MIWCSPRCSPPATNTDARLQNLGLGVLKELKPRQPGEPESSESESESETEAQEQGEESDILAKLLNGNKRPRGRPGIQEVEEAADTPMSEGGDVERPSKAV